MSSASVRPKRRQDSNYQSYTNPNQSHNNRSAKKWNNNSNNQHSANMTPRNQQPISSQTQPSVNSNHHNNTPISNNAKPVEQTVHDEVSTEHMHDRLMFLLVNLVGMNVSVTVKNGAKYQGLFKSASTKGELGVVLKMARRVLSRAEEKTVQNRVIPTYIILAKDLVEIHACGVDFTTCDGDREGAGGSGFRTDADISGRTELRERELHKWTPDESGEIMKGLEDDINSDSGHASWDQFAANEQLFGIKTDFNEEIYTTKLDRSRADFKERERQAIAIANEITRSSTTNVHMLEERGFIVEESQMDEEERYGAVVRNRDPNKYTPPQLRKIQEQQSQGSSVPVVKKPELIKEPVKEVKVKSAEETKQPKQTQPSPTTTTAAITTPPATATAQKIPPFSSSSPLTNTSVPRKSGVDAEGGKPIEDQIFKNFQQFATNEKERLQQRMQAIKKKDMDEKVDELRKWRQTFKLKLPLPQDLLPIMTKDKTKQKQLTAESATALNEKEKEKVSDKQKDKDKEKLDKEKEKEKQQEKQEKEKDKDKLKDKDIKPKLDRSTSTQNLEPKIKPDIKIEDKSQKANGDSTESKSANEKGSDKPTSVADKAPPQFPSRANATSSNNSQFKLNAKANEWKPNPNAASFTPITPNTQDKRSPGSSPFFVNRQLKKNTATLKEGFNPFQKGKPANPSSITPTWPFGNRSFRHQFAVTSNYEEDIYSQVAVTQGFGFAYPVGHYRYPNAQFVSVPPIPIQQGAPIPYMQPGQFVPGMPFTSAPMPPNGAPPMYGAQLPSVIPQHFGTQGYPSPGRTPMVPATVHPQMYQPYQNPHAIPPMMRFPHDIVQHVPPNGVMISQRPVIMEPHSHYVQPEAAPMGMPVSESTTTQ